MTCIELWAKDNGESLEEHTDKCLALWRDLALERKPIYARLASKLGLDEEGLVILTRETIVAHDLGKGTHLWQKYIRDPDKKGKITHALFSFYIFGEAKNWPRDKYFLASSLAILAHHQMLHNNSYQNDSFNSLGTIGVYNQELTKFLASRMEFDGNIPSKVIGFKAVQKVQMLKKFVHKIVEKEFIKFKSLYTFLLAVLTYVDHEASREKNSTRSLKNIWDGFIKSPVGINPNILQQKTVEKVAAGEENFLVQAGCGTGKTGAALWAGYELFKQGKVDKIIFTLPTKFTSNSMYWDCINSEKYNFSPEDVGIFHSEVESLLIKEDNNEDEDYTVIEKRINSWYAKPLNISTIDHLLYSLLHCYRYADRAFGHLQTSVVIFDEIHYYDKNLLAKIGQCIQLLRKLGIPHIIMSATLPVSLQEALKEQVGLGETGYVSIDFNHSEDAPCRIQKMGKPILNGEEINPDLLKLIEENLSLRQMVVVNQVERAKRVARTISEIYKNINIICYHSQFTREDREVKEKIIKILFKNSFERTNAEVQLIEQLGFHNNDQVILVTTQICELSLDISSHVMYSEIAPVDSLVQRAGRLHRKGKYFTVSYCTCSTCKSGSLPNDFCYNFYIFPVNWEKSHELLPYGFDPEDNILSESWSILGSGEGNLLTGKCSKKWVNQLYSQRPRLIDTAMLQAIKEDIVFGKKPIERFGDPSKEESQGSFRVREEIVPSFIVIPSSLYDEKMEVHELLKNRGVRVSRNRAVKEKLSKVGEVLVLDVPYTRELGFEFSTN